MTVMIAGLRRARIETVYASMIFPFVVGNIIITSLVLFGQPVVGRLAGGQFQLTGRTTSVISQSVQ